MQESSPPRFAAIVSGVARRRPEIIALVEAHRTALGHASVQIVNSSAEAIAAARAAAATRDVVIAVGGDGTVSDIATGLLGSEAVLGIVPAGSTNIVAANLGIPRDYRAAVQLLAGRYATRPIDVGLSNGHCFLHMAGAGFDAEIFHRVNRPLKGILGWPAYLPAALGALRLPPARVRVTVDGLTRESVAPLVLVANGGSVIREDFELFTGIAVDDGQFDVLIFSTVTIGQVANVLGLTGIRRLDHSPHVLRIRGSTAVIESHPAMRVQLDGDVRGHTPATFELVPLGLRIAVPTA